MKQYHVVLFIVIYFLILIVYILIKLIYINLLIVYNNMQNYYLFFIRLDSNSINIIQT